MVQVWDRDLLDKAALIEWNKQPAIQKDYANTVTYFTKQLTAIGACKAAVSGAS